MSNAQKKSLGKYIAAIVFVLLLAGLYIGLRDFLNQPLVTQYLIIADALTIPGLLLILLGCMIWASDLGGLYGIGYVLNVARNSVLQFVVPGAIGKTEKYFDYVQRKKAEGHVTGYGFLFVVGGITMLVSFVFMFLFYQLYSL